MLVVMADVVAKDGFEMTTAKNERPVEALFTYGPYPALRDRVRAWRPDGCLDHLDAFRGEHLVEAGGELRVAVSDQEPERPSVLGEIACEVAGNLGDEGAGRMIGDPEDVDYAALELDDEHHIELGETDRVHDEEVGGQDAARLGGEELLPGRSTARSWSEPVAAKDPADRARRDVDRKPAKLALDADTTPAAVLPVKGPSLTMSSTISSPSGGRPGPRWARQRFHLLLESSRCQRSRVSGVTRKQRQRHQVLGCAQQGSLGLRVGSARGHGAAVEQADLVAKHHQLDVLVQSCPSAGSQYLKNAARDEVAETEAQGR